MSGVSVQSCATCGESYLDAPAGRCRGCGAETLTEVEIAPTGVVVASTTVRLAPPGVEVPYTLAYADFEPGARLLARVDGPIRTGDRVRSTIVDNAVERFRIEQEAGR